MNRKNKTFIFIVIHIFFLKFSSVLAQDKYAFTVENPIKYKFDPSLYDGVTFEFEGNRIYLKKNIFYETSVLRVIDTFKIKNNKWYIKNNNRWDVFFSKNLFDKQTTIKWKNIYIKPMERIIQNNKIYYLYYLSPDEKFISKNKEDYVILYFLIEEGIVKIEYQNFTLVRIWENFEMKHD
jgi:hypothetical protein